METILRKNLTYKSTQLRACQRAGTGNNGTGLDISNIAKEFLARKKSTEGQLVERLILASKDSYTRLHDQASRGIVLLLETVAKNWFVVHIIMIRIRLVDRLSHGLLKGLDNPLPELLGLVVAQLRVLVMAEIQLGT